MTPTAPLPTGRAGGASPRNDSNEPSAKTLRTKDGLIRMTDWLDTARAVATTTIYYILQVYYKQWSSLEFDKAAGVILFERILLILFPVQLNFMPLP